MEHIMWVERPLELMFEGHDTRWEDLTRWDKVQEQYDRLASKRYVLIQKNLYEFDPVIHTNFTEETALKEFEDAANHISQELIIIFQFHRQNRTRIQIFSTKNISFTTKTLK